ncbi:hypothetical protein [Acrocarpospora sp. B8E8]|uniref:hypothetical protein n=1 Tax=Acrocarpospora sp. B8E8 TaxID=3153572 RepID=UPI00325CEBBC
MNTSMEVHWLVFSWDEDQDGLALRRSSLPADEWVSWGRRLLSYAELQRKPDATASSSVCRLDVDGQIVALHRHPTAEVDPRKRIRTYAYLNKQTALGARDVLGRGEDWHIRVPGNLSSGPPLPAELLPKLTEEQASAYTERVRGTNRDALRKLVTEVLRNIDSSFSCRIDARIDPRLVMWGLMDLLDGVVGVGDPRYWTFSTDESDDLGRDLPRFVFLDQWKISSLESAHKRIDLTNITRFADDLHTQAASHLVEAYWAGGTEGVAKLRKAAGVKDTGRDDRRVAALRAYAQKVTVIPTTEETTSRDMTPRSWEEPYGVVEERALTVGGDILDYEPQFTAEQSEHAQVDVPVSEVREQDPTVAIRRDDPRHRIYEPGEPADSPHSPYAAGGKLREVFAEPPASFRWGQIGDNPPSEPTTPAPHSRSGRPPVPAAKRAPAPGGNAPPPIHAISSLAQGLLQVKDARTVEQYVHAMATSAHHGVGHRQDLRNTLIEHKCFHDFFSKIDGVDVETEIEKLVESAFLADDFVSDKSAVKKAARIAAMTGMPDVVIASLAKLTGQAGFDHARVWLDLVVEMRSEQARTTFWSRRKSRQQGTAQTPKTSGGNSLSREEKTRSILERVVLIAFLSIAFVLAIGVAIFLLK